MLYKVLIFSLSIKAEGVTIRNAEDSSLNQIIFTNTLLPNILKNLSEKNVKLNITAIMNHDQVKSVMSVLNHKVPSIISVFAGRVADTGRDPIPLMIQLKYHYVVNWILD